MRLSRSHVSLCCLAVLLILGCNEGGGGQGSRNADVDLDFPSGTLRGRVVPMTVSITPEMQLNDPVNASEQYVLTLFYSIDNTNFLPATLLASPGADTNIIPADAYLVGQTTQIPIVWNRKEDITNPQEQVFLRLSALLDREDGPVVGSVTMGPRDLNWGALSPCTKAAPRLVTTTITIPRGGVADHALVAEFGELPLTWSVNEPLQGGLVLDGPGGRITGTTDASTPGTQVRLFTTTDACSGRQDMAWITVRVQ